MTKTFDETIAAAKETLGDFSLHEFNIVKQFDLLICNGDEPIFDLTLRLTASGNRALTILCKEIYSLSINQFSFGFLQITGLEVIDISSRQWERKNWEVKDYESGRLHFYCNSVAIASVNDKRI
ncbi:MAG TPA: hypothetical protein VND94_09685 [Terriglobia bacterium]|nr:hypothetical protein [Terriglobia bacterium]